MEKSIFRKSSLDRISSPEQLNDYIRVSSPSVWLILAAMLALTAALFVWAVFGNIPTTYTVTGEAKDGRVVCYLPPEDALSLKTGMAARVGEVEGTIESVAPVPLSYEEAAALYESEYTVHSLKLADWNTSVIVIAQAPDGLQEVTIIVDSQRPMAFLTN